MGWRETYRSRPSNIPQIIASARGPTNPTKKGPHYYTSGPELLTSLKGTQVAVLRGDGGTHIVLDDDRYVSSQLQQLLQLRPLQFVEAELSSQASSREDC